MVRRKYVILMPKSGYKYPGYGDLRLTCFTLQSRIHFRSGGRKSSRDKTQDHGASALDL